MIETYAYRAMTLQLVCAWVTVNGIITEVETQKGIYPIHTFTYFHICYN